MNTNQHHYSIGQFASYGRVSVRMLRHYDAIGLLPPHRVDPSTGYRWYSGDQFAVLTRIVHLRTEGFSLEQIGTILDGATPASVVRALYEARARELRRGLDEDRRRLESVEETLLSYEGDAMNAVTDGPTVTITSIEPVRLYVARDHAAGFGPQFIGPVVGPLFARLADDLRAAGISPDLPAISWYVALDDEDGRVEVNASFTAGDGVPVGAVADRPFEVIELPALEQAAVTVHHGPPDTIGEAWMRLGEWVSREGWTPAGPCREVYLSPDDVPMEEWVTELHYPVVRA